jgi:hypothetical protein
MRCIAVDLVADLDGWKDQRNGGGGKHVVLADLGPADQRVEAQTLGNSNAGSCIDEDDGLPRADVRGAHGEGAKRAAANVSPEAAPANGPSNEGRERRRIEYAACLTGAAEEHTIKARGLAKPKPEHVG